ncbi:MAG TPA: MotA/TolQ/ExbB proton channel family protein [Coleofasciculaceae cyanobacterium]|jgi:chemotaxis protein MotA
MDGSTLAGLGLGLAILALALLIGHVPLETLLNPEALLVVFGGTLAATMVSFSRASIWRALGALRGGAQHEGASDIRQTVAYVMDVVNFVRDEGILALQPVIDSIEIPFLRKGLMLVLDNRTEKFIRESLSTEIEVIYREDMNHARIFETAGGYAPTMGIIGAVIGLICVVQSFKDPAQLGKGVASSFSATLYGVALSNLFLLPLAGKLRQRAREDWFIRTLLLEAILSVRLGEHPLLVEERLNAFAASARHENTVQTAKPYATGRESYQGVTLPPQAVMSDDFLQVSGVDA